MDVKCYRCSHWPCECKDGQTIIHGDCRDVLPELGTFDLVLTDPPYGIGISSNPVRQSHERSDWDDRPCDRTLLEACIAAAGVQFIWGGNYFGLPPNKCFFVWDKEQPAPSLADCEYCWTSLDRPALLYKKRVLSYKKQHPTQKPLELFKWCMSFAKEAHTVLDPFLGSGTTLRACKDLGRKGTGIELEEKYCEIAANRLKQEVLF